MTHHYHFAHHEPHDNWDIELKRLKILAQAYFIFDEEAAFTRQDPLEILQLPSGDWILGPKAARAWTGSYKTNYRVKFANDSSPKDYALSQVPQPRLAIPKAFDSELEDSDLKDREAFEAAQNEAAIIRAIESGFQTEGKISSGILRFEAVHDKFESGRILFLAPFKNRGDAYRRSLAAPIQPEDQITITQELLNGLAFLHRNRIAHRDIKPNNILLNREGPHLHAVIADFGTAYQEGQANLETQLDNESFIRTTTRYVAPEAVEKFYLRSYQTQPAQLEAHWLQLKKQVSLPTQLSLRWNPSWTHLQTDQSSDLWSLGTTLLEIVTRIQITASDWTQRKKASSKPQDYLAVQQDDVDDVLSRLEDEEFKPWIAEKLIPIIRCLLRVNPSDRCSAQEASDLIETAQHQELEGVLGIVGPAAANPAMGEEFLLAS